MKMNETVAGLTISAKTEGVPEAKKQVDGLTQSTEKLGVVSEQSSKGARSLEESWKRATLRFDEGARSQAAFARETKMANDAVRNGVATQQQANEHLARVAERYGQASAASRAFAVATSGVNAQLVAMAAGAGPVGTFLAALGPWGFAASVGLGAVSAVLNRVVEGANRIGDKSIEMKKFSDVTGLSVTEIKGLTKAGAELGVSSDDITTSIERFSVGLFVARNGSGALFDQVTKINPALARQLAEAKSTAQGFDILAQAIKGATDAAQRNALARAAFGRGGIETGLVAAATVEKGGVAAMGEQIAKNTGLTQEWVRETARLRQENIELEKATTAAMDAAFALPVLQRQNEYLRTLKTIADLTIKGGGFKAPGADDPGAAFADYLSPPTAPLSQRGPSEGAMQAQAEAAAQREVVNAINEANKAREYAVSVDKMLVTIAQETAEAEKRKAVIFAQNAAAYQGVSAMTAQTLAQLEDQLGVAKAITGVQQIEAQYYASINALLTQGKSMVDAIAIAEAQREITLARINAEADRQLKTLQNEYEIIQATSEAEKGRIRAAQEYDRLIERGVSADRAGAIASQMQANARATQDAADNTESWSVQMDNANDAINRVGNSIENATNEMAQLVAESNRLRAALSFVPTITLGLGGGTSALQQSNQGGYSQFNPQGYASTTSQSMVALMAGQARFGAGNFNLQQLPGGGVMPVSNKTEDVVGSQEWYDKMFPAIEKLTDATKANTEATQTQTDVLSPFYSSDPRRTHLGFRAFAGGGIMTQYGELPLKQYQGGGVASTPQVAMYGEGSTPEAYVPVPSGKIPVELKMPANSNQRPVNVTINVMGNADANTVAALKTTAFQQAQTMRRSMA